MQVYILSNGVLYVGLNVTISKFCIVNHCIEKHILIEGNNMFTIIFLRLSFCFRVFVSVLLKKKNLCMDQHICKYIFIHFFSC